MSEDNNGQKSSGQGTSGKGNSNGNGHSIAVADGNGTGGGPGVSTGHDVPAKGGSGSANGSSSQTGPEVRRSLAWVSLAGLCCMLRACTCAGTGLPLPQDGGSINAFLQTPASFMTCCCNHMLS